MIEAVNADSIKWKLKQIDSSNINDSYLLEIWTQG